MADFGQIADAIAARFLGTTPPTGESAIRTSTADLPNDVGVLPAFFVNMPDDEWADQTASGRTGVLTYECDLVLPMGDEPRTYRRVLNWRTALYSRLDGQVHLGLTGVAAIVTKTAAARITYGAAEYPAVRVTVKVTVREAANYVA